jgi:DNA-nicking Smr family endonuclease
MSEKKTGPASITCHSLKELRKIIKSRGMRFSYRLPSAACTELLSDNEVFKDAMKEVREIKEFRNLPVYKKKAPAISRACSPDDEVLKTLEEIVSGKRPVKLQHTQEYVEWANKDYRGGVVKNLHEGRFSVQDTLDLHGTVMEEAETLVCSFLKEARRKSFRCIKIVHGRGLRSPNGPVLKKAVIRWLSVHYRKQVIAFATARQCDGGLGALYVLLHLPS